MWLVLPNVISTYISCHGAWCNIQNREGSELAPLLVLECELPKGGYHWCGTFALGARALGPARQRSDLRSSRRNGLTDHQPYPPQGARRVSPA